MTDTGLDGRTAVTRGGGLDEEAARRPRTVGFTLLVVVAAVALPHVHARPSTDDDGGIGQYAAGRSRNPSFLLLEPPLS